MSIGPAQRTLFIDYLRERGLLSPEQACAVDGATRPFQEAVASIALRNQLIDPVLLDELLECGDAFLSEAVRRGALTREYAERLQVIEAFREVLEVVETIVLEGVAEPSAVRRELSAFLARVTES